MFTVRRPPDVSDVARRLLLSRRPALPGPVPYQHSPGVGTQPARSVVGPPRPGGNPDPTTNYPGVGGFDPSGQASAEVAAQLDPILAYITQRYGAQASGVSQAFGQLTNEYSGALKGYAGEVPGMFAPSEKIVQGAAKGIKHQLVELGKSTQAGQDAATSFAGLPQGAGAEDIPLKKIGKGSGGAAYAIGGAALDALRAEQATAEKYAGQLPGFAQLEGQANTRSVLSRLAGEMADQLAQTTAEAPKLYYQIYNDLQDRAANDRNFAEQVREWNATQNAATAKQKASMAGPQAPTLAGRQAYWDSVAADRTKTTGVQYVGTTTGIRPVDANPSKPGIQTAYTLQGRAAQQAGIKTQAQINNENRRTGIAQQNANTSARNATTSARRADTAQAAENSRHAEAQRRLNIAAQNARTSAQRAAVTRRSEVERERHNRETERIARMKKKPAAASSEFDPANGKY